MKLINFNGKNIRGYLNMNIDFKDELSFLVGMNGSGKTSALKLILGVMEPSIVDLINISFDEINLSFCNDDSHQYDILVIKNKESIHFKITIDDKERINNQFNTPVYQTRNIPQTVIQRFEEELNIEFERSDYYKEMRTINTPIVLGINRTDNATIKELYEVEEFRYRNRFSNGIKHQDHLYYALRDIQEKVYRNIRERSNSQSNYINNFRNSLLEESFNFIDLKEIENFIDFRNKRDEIRNLQTSLNELINSIGENHLIQPLNEFCNKLDSVLLTLEEENASSEKYSQNVMQYILNTSQLVKLSKGIEIAKEYNDQIQKLKKILNQFTESMNSFLAESGKEIYIDAKGDIYIKLPNSKTNTIFELSSGEKQLLVLVGSLVFNRKNSVFIVDEPELSLHLSWQRLFVKALQTASPSSQFIYATHAPAIIAENKWKENCIDLTPEVRK